MKRTVMKSIRKKQFAFTFFGLLFVSTSFAQWGKGIKGNGKVTSVTRSTSDYEGIKCAGSMNFVLVKGKEGNIEIEGEENLLEYIITEVKDNKLIVKTKKGTYIKPSWGKPIKITIPFEDISSVSLSGSGDIVSEDIINAENLSVYLSDSGDIVLNIKTESTESASSGSGDITLKGVSNNLKTKITGSGDFHGFDLDTNNTEASTTGSGDIEVVSNKFLKARVTGSGDIEYRGDPKLDTTVSGSGSIRN
ncbi:head GIN domain-containing protein [Hyunsoonleella rubra]|uniref:Head GIN domain-containing protein n=1 Tax=Hyunsoonleella rubra TaxID=1737062 RepID=A0ABW5TGM0_9FLAO